MAVTSVQRDPFARGEYARESFGNAQGHASCAWCGSRPRVLYRYVWVDDGSRRAPRFEWAKAHCNIGCRHAWADGF